MVREKLGKMFVGDAVDFEIEILDGEIQKSVADGSANDHAAKAEAGEILGDEAKGGWQSDGHGLLLLSMNANRERAKGETAIK